MRPIALAVFSLFALAFSDPVTATDPHQNLTTAYLHQNPPSMVGTVVATTDHTITLDTDDHERLTLEYDSRSMVPAEMPVGGRMKVEFELLDNGTYHANRVVPIRTSSGEIAMGEIQPLSEEHAEHMDMEGEGEVHTERNTSAAYEADHDHYSANVSTTSGSQESGEEADLTAADVDRDANANDLPRTGSAQPLIGALGMLALAGAVTLWALRRESA